MPQYEKFAMGFSTDQSSQRQLMRALMNMRPPMPMRNDYIVLQDEILSSEQRDLGVVEVDSLPTTSNPKITLWRGDITRLNADAIVNAANKELLGCFFPCHGCIDNAIHSAAGSQLREACDKIMENQRSAEPTGQAKITDAYNLPSKYVIHTVGPIITGELQGNDRTQLASCYSSCLAVAEHHKLQSIAFCCISTGEYKFPPEEAAEIALKTVVKFIKNNNSNMKVIFNVFKKSDEVIYQRLLGENR